METAVWGPGIAAVAVHLSALVSSIIKFSSSGCALEGTEGWVLPGTVGAVLSCSREQVANVSPSSCLTAPGAEMLGRNRVQAGHTGHAGQGRARARAHRPTQDMYRGTQECRQGLCRVWVPPLGSCHCCSRVAWPG